MAWASVPKSSASLKSVIDMVNEITLSMEYVSSNPFHDTKNQNSKEAAISTFPPAACNVLIATSRDTPRFTRV